MNIENINEIAIRSMMRRKSHLQREKGFIYFHCQRVAKLSINLRRCLFPAEETKDDVMYVGALFHDLTKGIEPHNETGAQLVKTILSNECTAKEIEEISEIIQLHNSRKQVDQQYYISLVQDADILDHFGSMEIWLKFMYSAHVDENVFDAIRLWESEEHKQYLMKSRESLNFDKSKEIFDKKLEFELGFQKRFSLECNGIIDL
jgi:uncharacterized protein